MGIQLTWLVLSHGFLQAAGRGLYEDGNLILAALLVIVVPLARVGLRFHKKGGYRLFRNADDRTGVGSGFVRRRGNPILFWFLILIELAIIVVFAVAMINYQK